MGDAGRLKQRAGSREKCAFSSVGERLGKARTRSRPGTSDRRPDRSQLWRRDTNRLRTKLCSRRLRCHWSPRFQSQIRCSLLRRNRTEVGRGRVCESCMCMRRGNTIPDLGSTSPQLVRRAGVELHRPREGGSTSWGETMPGGWCSQPSSQVIIRPGVSFFKGFFEIGVGQVLGLTQAAAPSPPA
jgi:hypothetical protein